MRARSLVLTLVALALVACDTSGAPAAPEGSVATPPVQQATVAPPDATTPEPGRETGSRANELQRVPPDRPFYGIAGLIPPNYPDATDDDWVEFFQALPALGGVVGNYSQISGLDANQEAGMAAGVGVLPVTSFHLDTDDGVEVTDDLAESAARASFIEALTEFAGRYQPPYLGVGNEVNRIWEDDPEAFAAWVDALPELVAAVHEVSPGTRVFATFQYEFLIGRAAITGVVREADWTPFEQVEPHVDLVAFTSYPYFEYAAPAAIPDDYYAPIAERTALPVGFTEVGWPSAAIAPLEDSVFADLGGSPEEQVAFVERLGPLLERVDLAFAMWVWAYDTEAVGPTFGSLGLHATDGTPKPALDAWRALIAR